MKENALGIRVAVLDADIVVQLWAVEDCSVVDERPCPSRIVVGGERMAVRVFHRADRGKAYVRKERALLDRRFKDAPQRRALRRLPITFVKKPGRIVIVL